MKDADSVGKNINFSLSLVISKSLLSLGTGSATLPQKFIPLPVRYLLVSVPVVSVLYIPSIQQSCSLNIFNNTCIILCSYPFDVNEAILWLAELCDMVFVFFDPIGQALCKRTLNIVESIRKTCLTS